MKMQTPRRILYLTFYFEPDLCAGSFRNTPLAFSLAELAKQKHTEIDLYTTIPNRYISYEADYREKETVHNLTIHRLAIPRHKSGKLDQMRSFYSYYRQVMKLTRHKEYDLVFASSSRFFTSWLGYRVAKKKRAKLIVDVRDLLSDTVKDLSRNRLMRSAGSAFIRALEKRVYHYASHLNLISPGFRPAFREIPSNRVSEYSHGVDPDFTDAIQKQSQSTSSLSAKSVTEVLYAGNIGEGQGLHNILPGVASALRETHHFTVIGDGSAITQLKRAIEEMNLTNVTLRKPVSRVLLVREYMEADILFLHLESGEVFRRVLPSKIFEMAATGRPIVAGVEGYARTFLQKEVAGTGLFSPGDCQEAVDVIRRVGRNGGDVTLIDRSLFIKTYSRPILDQQFAEKIVSFLQE